MPTTGDGANDADSSISAARCGHGAHFGAPALVRGLEGVPVLGARLNKTESNIYLSVLADAGVDLFIAGRTYTDAAFGPLAKLAISTESDDYWPTVDADERTMFFESGTNPDVPADTSRIWFTMRDNTTEDFRQATLSTFFSILPGSTDSAPYLSPSGTSLFFTSINRPDMTVSPPLESTPTQDIWEIRTNGSGTAISNRRLTEISSDVDAEQFPVITADGLEIFFTRTLLGDDNDEIWVAQRDSIDLPFDSPSPVDNGIGPVNSADGREWASWISPDNCRLYFIRSARSGPQPIRLWVAERRAP